MPRPLNRIFSPVFWLPAFVGAAGAVLCASPTAREVATDSLQIFIVVITTPFVLEATCALLFIGGLLAYNHWRLKKDGDGWVYLVDQETDDASLPPALTERLHNLVLTEKPAPLDETEACRSVIEGYLELGMGAQALAEYESAGAWPDDAISARLHIRLLAANMDTDLAVSELAQSVARFPEERSTLATTALDIARWMRTHVRQAGLVERWLHEASILDPALATDDPMRI